MKENAVEKNFDNIFIVVPAYNEGLVIKETINSLKKHFKNIIVVNDGSTDDTYEIIKNLGIRIINHPLNIGVGGAFQTGFNYILKNHSNCSGAITFDADGQHKVKDAINIADKLINNNYEIIFGSRFLGHESKIPFIKRLVLRTVVAITNFFTGVKLTDAHNGLKGFKMSAINKINIRLDGYAYETELIRQVSENSISYIEVPTDIEYSDYSKNKGQTILNGFIIIEDLLKLWK